MEDIICGREWHRLHGFRNRIVHDYYSVDLNIVWNIICNQTPSLIKDIERIIDSI
ncbi:MAG: HepT-like ribonuclease domain-containing protein [Bacteroidota bacterium]